MAQTAAKLVLEPIFEADFEDNAYGYRPRRGAVDAVKDVHRHLCRGYTDVADADLSKYFDNIPHRELMQCVARRIVDRHVLALIKMWLKAPVEERDGDGKRRIVGGKGNTRGTPQGGVASPLLANIYMNRFLKHWRLTARGEAFRAYVVSYADDFVILSRGRAAEALAWTKAVMMRLGLTINEAKTSLRNARQERFNFLGYSFGPHYPYKSRVRWCMNASPSKKSVQRQVRDELNRSLRGWSSYFCFGTRVEASRSVDRYVRERVRGLVKRWGWGAMQQIARGEVGYPLPAVPIDMEPHIAYVTKLRPIPQAARDRALARRSAHVTSLLSRISVVLTKSDFNFADVNGILREIAEDPTLVHASYYTEPECIDMIAYWLARSEEDFTDENWLHAEAEPPFEEAEPAIPSQPSSS